MARTRSLILLEMNELTPTLMDRFIRQGQLPNFAAFRDTAECFTTDAGEIETLEPWIQWVTIHSGVPARQHGIRELGEGAHFRGERVWDALSAAGFRVWLCGSMNIAHRDPLNGATLPDPWARDAIPASARAFEPFIRFVRAQVQEHTNVNRGLSKIDGLRFLAFMARHGLSWHTTTAIASQLLDERNGDCRWKRACLLDKLQFDLFRHHYLRTRPHFSTFFLNSTAHFQHLYWRNFEPGRFRLQPTAEEQASRRDAILHGYREMDGLLGRFMALAGKEVTLVFCTGLSQQPHLLHEPSGGKVFYRPRSFARFLDTVGCPRPRAISPVMSEQFHLDFADQADATIARRVLARLRVEGKPMMLARRKGASVFAGCRIFESLPAHALVTDRGIGEPRRFFDLFYQVEGMKSGRHHPDGMLWIRTPERRHAVHPKKVPLVSLAPTILTAFGVPRPASMKGEPLPVGLAQRRRVA